MISKELLIEVFGFEFIPATGKELLEHSFGYAQGLRTSCRVPLKNDEWICIHGNELTFGFKDIRPEVLKNIPDGVYTKRTINLYELAHLCKEWAIKKDYGYIINSCTKHTKGCAQVEWYEKNHSDKHGGYRELTFYSEWFKADNNNEPEAIIKACQWIFEQNQ